MSLDDARAALRATRYELVAQIEQIDQALALLGGAGGGSDQKMPRTAPTKKTERAGASHACPDCLRGFASPNGLAVHRARAHGAKKWNSKPKTTALADAALRSEATATLALDGETQSVGGEGVNAEPKNPRKALICDSCGYSSPSLNAEVMNKHTLAEHQRIASRSERLPKAV